MQVVNEPDFLSKCSPKIFLNNYASHLLLMNVINFGYEFNVYANVCPLYGDQIISVKERCNSVNADKMTSCHCYFPASIAPIIFQYISGQPLLTIIA